MQRCTKTITKEQYDEIQANGLDKYKYFSDAIIWGYGLYSAKAEHTDDDKYIINYTIGDSCD